MRLIEQEDGYVHLVNEGPQGTTRCGNGLPGGHQRGRLAGQTIGVRVFLDRFSHLRLCPWCTGTLRLLYDLHDTATCDG